MKSLIHWTLTLGLTAGAFIGPSIIRPIPAIAIPESEAVKRFERIPVFTVTNPAGSPILATLPNPQDKTKQIQVANFFIDEKDAQAFLKALKTNSPELGKEAKIVPISLKQAYTITTQNKDKQESLIFQFLPTQEQLTFALDILNKDKPEAEQLKSFNGVPLFYAVGGPDKGLLTVSDQAGKNKIIPFYFRKQDLERSLEQLQKQDQALGKSTAIEVTSLDRVFDSLLKETGDAIEQITLIPSADAIQYTIQQQKGTSPAQEGESKTDAPKQETKDDSSKQEAKDEVSKQETKDDSAKQDAKDEASEEEKR